MNRRPNPSGNRRSTPKVKSGKVQRKNRSKPTQSGPLIKREPPGAGFRHIIRKTDIDRFVRLLPEWEELSDGLNEIILAAGERSTSGWHMPGVVAICAWEHGNIRELNQAFVGEHASLFDRLGILYSWIADEDYEDNGYFMVQYSDDSIRAYQLLHIFLHELGHHHDRMTTRDRRRASRGESFAEVYAYRNESLVYDRYCQEFGFEMNAFKRSQ